MRTIQAFVGSWLAVSLVACGSSSKPPAAGPENFGYRSESAPSPASAPASGGTQSLSGSAPTPTSAADAPASAEYSPPPPAAPPPSPASAESHAPRSTSDATESWAPQPEPEPRERPGLGTEWGESRESHVQDVTFFRAVPERPFAVAQVFYNDRAGVDALAAYHGGSSPHPIEVSAGAGQLTVYLVDKDWEMPLDATRVGDRTYIVGQEGHRYSILIANRTGHRYEAVATVDGLDVISGREGRFDRRGYVLSPWATLEIDGFRKDEDTVAAFRFSKVNDSYAAERGAARNVGVIGIAFFAERGDEWSSEELRTRDRARPFPGQGRFAPPPG